MRISLTSTLAHLQRHSFFGKLPTCPTNSWFKLLPLVLLAACTTAHKQADIVTAVPPGAPHATFVASNFENLPDWQKIDLHPSWMAFLQSCYALQNKPEWQAVCAHAIQLSTPDNNTLRLFFSDAFTPYQVFNPDGSSQGLITGYYEPKLSGSRSQTARFKYPVYAAPDDLLVIDLSEVYPQLKNMRLRGRLAGKHIIPYYSRAEIDEGKARLQVLFWVDNQVELFFLQIQGSGRIELPDGHQVKVGYADQNGYPYVSIGKKLVETGELKIEQASMQGIKHWAEHNPTKLTALLAQNPSYVFFRELPESLSAPLGGMGVPLTEQYSLAVDPHILPLGAPVFLSTTYPNTTTPLNRLMLAQDIGGAIRGAVRADFFWGFGEKAGEQAGRMKQSGQMWLLLPKGVKPAPD
jgi:membrane-bound lytic murein transglycosylase A